MQFRRITLWLLAATIFLTPLVFYKGVFFAHIFTKAIVFRTLVELAFAFWVSLCIANKSYRPRMSYIAYAIVAFFLVSIVSALLGVDLSGSIWSDLERMMGLVTMLHVIAFFFMVASFTGEEDARRMFVYAFIGSSALVALYGIIEPIVPPARVASTIGNASFLASYLLLSVGIHVWLFVDTWRSRASHAMRWVYIAGGVLSLITLFLSGSRGAVVGLLAGVAFGCVAFIMYADASWRMGKVSFRMIKRIVLGGGIGLALIFAAVVFMNDTVRSIVPSPYNRYIELNFEERTTEGRLLAWRVSWEAFKEKPLLGWGPENYNIAFDRHYDPRLYNQEPWFDRAHNILFDVGVTTGIVGLLAYGSIFGAVCWALWQGVRRQQIFLPSAIALGALLVAYIAHNMFTFDTLTTLIPLYIIFAHVHNMSHEKEESKAITKPHLAVIGGVIIVMAVVAWRINIQPWNSNRLGFEGYKILSKLADTNDEAAFARADNAAISTFESALKYDTYGDIDIRRFSAEYVFDFLKRGGDRPESSMTRIMQYAINNMEKNIAEDPTDVRWYMYEGELYSLLASKYDKAYASKSEEYFLKAEQLSPGRPQIYIELAQALKEKGDIARMWEVTDKVIQMLPEYAILHANALVHAIEVENRAREDMELAWIRDHQFRDIDPKIIRDAYFRVKRYHEAIVFQELHITFREESDSPDLVKIEDAYAQLAALYKLVGDKEKAREAAMKVLEINPNSRASVEAFLKTLDE